MTITAATQNELHETIRECAAAAAPMNIVGGATALDYGLPASADGVDIITTKLNRMIDFPADDMTVTVEAGVTKAALDQALAEKNLRLAIDVPHHESATLGGIVACNWNGPRRFGLGGVRDAVIGITAINGRGELFHGGGRVVKNVAGYDFCKLLTGSQGTLAVITQLTFKLRPVVDVLSWLIVETDDVAATLAAVNQSSATPSAVEFLSPNVAERLLQRTSDRHCIVIAIEGSENEVAWMQQQLREDCRGGDLLEGPAASELLKAATDFSAQSAPLAIRAAVLPSRLMEFVSAVRQIDPAVEILAHAADALVYCRFSEIPDVGVSGVLIGELQPLAEKLGGGVTMISNADQVDMTRHAVWGPTGNARQTMQSVKDQFDPQNLLNRGQFIFP